MKKHPTLEELVKERGLKPSLIENNEGRWKDSCGYSVVHIMGNNTYTTYNPRAFDENEIDNKQYVLVRG